MKKIGLTFGLLVAGLVSAFAADACQPIQGVTQVAARYGEPARFSREISLQYPDFDLIYLGLGRATVGAGHLALQAHYFRAIGSKEQNIINWSAGTGLLGPIGFELGGKRFFIEMRRNSLGGQPGEGEELREDEVVIAPQR
jgi:hypothetical protein